jgi:hypothetical protein
MKYDKSVNKMIPRVHKSKSSMMEKSTMKYTFFSTRRGDFRELENGLVRLTENNNSRILE